MTPTFVDVLGERSGPAFESGAASIGYAELHSRARSIGASLLDRGLVGERVLILLPAGLDYVAALFGCWYAGAVAVPLSPSRDLARVLGDADPAAAIVPDGRTVPGVITLSTVLSTVDFQAAPEDWRRPAIGPDSLALLQYSGSGGVMVSHGNLVASARQTCRLFGAGPDAGVVSRLAPHRDLGLMTGVLHPVLAGSRATLLPPQVGPAEWLRAISDRHARVSGGPAAAFAAARTMPGVDLSTWDVAFTDAPSSTMDSFADRLAGNGFRRDAFFSCYWRAEATSLIAGRRGPAATEFDADTLASGRFTKPRWGGTPVVDRGRPADELEVAIVDPLTATRCPDGTAGEIWVSGPNVAVGYLGRPDVSERTFCARLRGSTDNFLRTGDLGFLHDGGLHVTDVLAA
ncbi:MAG: AMP-binding protein [Actinophytocola sp.]|uniref:AMP-binding protein n=1 Tax=Actinophytocola sp. TaxID=1872138 RepID=UPI0013220588|nr:AMP-binding protein [Actinophytocola sp.]MPZ81995.1 AMP-binding protein [Actinophytocola sp.]